MSNDAVLDEKIKTLAAQLQGVQGWLSTNSGAILYTLALEYTPTDVVVELGSWKGLSTCWLAAALRERGS